MKTIWVLKTFGIGVLLLSLSACGKYTVKKAALSAGGTKQSQPAVETAPDSASPTEGPRIEKEAAPNSENPAEVPAQKSEPEKALPTLTPEQTPKVETLPIESPKADEKQAEKAAPGFEPSTEPAPQPVAKPAKTEDSVKPSQVEFEQTEKTQDEQKPKAVVAPPKIPYKAPVPAPKPAATESPYVYLPLPWEKGGSPERTFWSKFLIREVESNFETLDQARDADTFCRRYDSLTKPERINFWAILISAVAFRESSWDPTSRLPESGQGIDKITGQPVYSEGLLQLSYQDQVWTKQCRFDWSKDKLLAERDPRKTILNPYANLRCGVEILAKQIDRHQLIAMQDRVYWAVLKTNGRYNKIPEIRFAVHMAMKACQ